MPRKLFRYIIVIVFFMILSFGYGYLREVFSFKKATPDNYNARDQRDVVRVKDQETTLRADAVVLYTVYYTGCGHEYTEEKAIEDRFVGLSKEELEEQIKDWAVVYFTPQQINLRRNIEGLCDEHYYIGIYQGYVALFKGEPGLESTPVEMTDIIVDVLREDDRNLLEQGMIIESKEEFMKIREGLTN